jgi:hypothetical protein
VVAIFMGNQVEQLLVLHQIKMKDEQANKNIAVGKWTSACCTFDSPVLEKGYMQLNEMDKLS